MKSSTVSVLVSLAFIAGVAVGWPAGSAWRGSDVSEYRGGGSAARHSALMRHPMFADKMHTIELAQYAAVFGHDAAVKVESARWLEPAVTFMVTPTFIVGEAEGER